MCGIVGEFRFDKKGPDLEILKQCIQQLSHRGPDDSGYWINDFCALGHVRLSIIDLSDNAKQPMTSENENTLSFNGEIFNFNHLKKKLPSNIEYKSNSDTEVLLNILDYDQKMIADLEGMFSFAYFDKDQSELILCRDHLGIKPLYYHVNDDRIVFSSEIKAILNYDGYEFDVNNEALYEHYMLGYSLAEKTLFKNINRLKPGQIIKITKTGIEKRQYFDLIEEVCNKQKHESDFLSDLNESVINHTISDVKTGIMLSGGFDSNILLHYLKRNKKIVKGFKAFNAGFESSNDKQNNKFDNNLAKERTIAELVTSRLNVDLEKISVESNDFISVEEFIKINEEPICNPSGFLIYEITKKAKNFNNHVLFSGHGGDEILSGYRRHSALNLINKFKLLKYLIRLIPLRFVKSNDLHRVFSYVKNSSSLFELSAIGKQFYLEGFFKNDFNLDLNEISRISKEFQAPIKKSRLSVLKNALAIEFYGYLSNQNLINMDKFSMINSVEVRVPFLSVNLVKSAFNLAEENIIKYGNGKLPLKNYAKENFPKSFFKLKKSGFSPSLKNLLYNEEVQELLLGNKTSKRGHINVEKIKRKLNSKNISIADTMQLLNIAFIEQWFRTYYDANTQ